VYLVHDAVAAHRLTPLVRRTALALAAIVILAGCGNSTPPRTAARAVSVPTAPASTANCAYWRVIDIPRRYAIIRAIRRFASGPVGSSAGRHGASLDDRTAYHLFDNYCAESFATRFKLYKLYTRAAAFGGGAGPPQ
jgi:hypothetical protein